MRIAITSFKDTETTNKEVHMKAVELLQTIHNAESSFVLYPYSSTSNSPPIIGTSHLPTTYLELKRYIPNLSKPNNNTARKCEKENTEYILNWEVILQFGA